MSLMVERGSPLPNGAGVPSGAGVPARLPAFPPARLSAHPPVRYFDPYQSPPVAMALPTVAEHQLELAQASYARCQQAPLFFRSFYDRFAASDPAIPPYFTHTKFEKQDRLLQHGISLLLIYAKRPDTHLLERIAERHGPQGDLKIPPRLYAPFVESFVATVRQYDTACDDATEEAWRAALAPGIDYLRGLKP